MLLALLLTALLQAPADAYKSGVLLYDSGKEAEGDAQFALVGSDDSEVYHAITNFYVQHGEVEHKKKNEAKAVEFFEKALKHEPDRPDLQPRLAGAYYDKKDFGKSAATFELVVALHPDNPDYWYMLGRCQIELKRYPQAVSAFQKVLALKSDDVEAISSIASVYQLQQDWPHSAAALERYVQLRPRDGYAYFLLATAYDRLQNVRQALLNYNKFLELDDGSSDARSFQARERAKTLQRRLKNPK
jgi:cytochrome c-type biogenesis protein CcmH/NrfG